jgi:hypothetical protein
MRCEEDPDIPVPDFGTLTGVYYLVKCIFHPVMFSPPLSFDPSFLAPVISKFIFKRRVAAPELLLER